MKRRQTKRGRVSLCRREFTAKDWRGKEGVLRLRRGGGGGKGHGPLMGTGRLSALPASSRGKSEL